jgi:hypothetical protein
MSRLAEPENPKDQELGFLTPLVKALLHAPRFLSPIGFLDVRPTTTESYVLACLLIEFIAAVNVTKIAGWGPLRWVVLLFAALKILEIVRVTASVVLFDEGVVVSVERIFILAAINFLELGLCFGLFYALHNQLLEPTPVGALTGFYFSFITQLTIGFGDVHPTGWLRIVAVIQGLTAALFVLLVFGKIVASLRPLKTQNDKPF